MSSHEAADNAEDPGHPRFIIMRATETCTGSASAPSSGPPAWPIKTIRRYAQLVSAVPGNEQERLALLKAHRDRRDHQARWAARQPRAHRLQDQRLL